MGILNDLLGSVKTTAKGGSSISGNLPGGYPAPVHPSVMGLTSALRRGMSCVMQDTGDSTGDAQTEWFGLLGTLLGQAYPQYSVHWRAFDDTNQRYDREPQIMQTGSAGTRWFSVDPTGTSSGFYFAGPNIPGDCELIANIKPNSWASGTQQTIVAKWDGGSANQRSVQFFLATDGKLGFSSSPDGGTTASNISVTSSAVVPFTNGQSGWVRVQHDVDNGSSGNTVTFQTSTDGITFTTLGTPVVNTGVVSHFASSGVWSFGVRNFTTGMSDFFTGAINEIWVMAGISAGAYHILPTMPEMWEPTGGGGFGTTGYSLAGAPVLQLWCGSRSGQNTPYMDNATRRPKVFANVGQQVLMVNMAMNDVGLSQTHARGMYQSWLTNVRGLLPGVPFLCLGQNPVAAQTSGLIPLQSGVDQRYLRNAALLQWAASGAVPGCWPMDKYPAWPQPTPTVLVADGVHPSQGLTGGAGYEARYLLYRLFGISL